MNRIAKIQIKDNAIDKDVSASIVTDITSDDVFQSHMYWQNYKDIYRRYNPSIKDEALLWDWRLKRAYYADDTSCKLYGLVCDSEPHKIQGLMYIKVSGFNSLVSGAEIPYVCFIEAAPWNRKDYKIDFNHKPEYSLVGSNLIYYARASSTNNGYGGRVALHALHGSEDFYKKLGFSEKISGSDLELSYFEC